MATKESVESTDEKALDTARTELCDAVPAAAATMRELLDAEDERVRLRAAEAILDRVGITKAEAATIGRVKHEVGDDASPTDSLPSELLR